MKYTEEQADELYSRLDSRWIAVDKVDRYGDILYQGWISIDDLQEALIIIEEFDKEQGIS